MKLSSVVAAIAVMAASGLNCLAQEANAVRFEKDVFPILRKYCLGCHNSKEAEGDLILENYTRISQRSGLVVAKKPDESLLWRSLSGKTDSPMPPVGEPQPSDKDKELIRRWIEDGAKAPEGELAAMSLVVPKIATRGTVRQPIVSLRPSGNGSWIAIAKPNEVQIVTADTRQPVRTLQGHSGAIHDVAFSPNSQYLAVAAGEPGLCGEATIWKTSDWSKLHVLHGHLDDLEGVAFNYDQTLLATSGYDQQITVWDVATGKKVASCSGHNGPVFSLSFHPKKNILASASGDRTVKLWDARTGQRLETFAQPAKEQYSVAFRPVNGQQLVAGGGDARVRVWDLSDTAAEGTNPIAHARFAHELPILRVAYSPDGNLVASASEDRLIKIFETTEYRQVGRLPRRDDLPGAMSFSAKGETLLVGLMNGSFEAIPVDPKWRAGFTPLKPMTDDLDMTRKDAFVSEATKLETVAEVSPDTDSAPPQILSIPGTVQGAIAKPGDVDRYQFAAKAGETWIIETLASRKKSPVDTRIEILDSQGKPVQRGLIQAVRDSWINFRPIDSNGPDVRLEYWEEMDLNQYLYMNGEICRTHRAPRGPDSGFTLYASQGKRRSYFDTSSTIHPKDQPAYIVEVFPPDAPIVENGLPVFPLFYKNDDDAMRERGTDSLLTFTAPADGNYVVAVEDSRRFGGPDYVYDLTIRRPAPDFRVKVSSPNSKVAAGGGIRVRFRVERIDSLNSEVLIYVDNLPAGLFMSSPVVIEAGQLEGEGVLLAASDAKTPSEEAWKNVRVRGVSTRAGETIEREGGNLGTLTVDPAPKYTVKLSPDDPNATDANGGLLIRPGTSITAMLTIERNNFDGEVRFEVDALPHGIIVDNIGLSGIMVRKGETSRQIFLTARPWVPETKRDIYAAAITQGNVASPAISLTVKR